MDFKKIEENENLEIAYICTYSGGFISRNKQVLNNLELNKLTQIILSKSVYGTPIFKLGNRGKKILIISGIHGNELPPQIANIQLINNLINKKLKNTLYFIPFAAPKSTMNNERTFNSMDLNRSAHIKNSISNLIINFAINSNINYIGDFHSTSYNANPGCESVFSSKQPTPESYLISEYISNQVGSKIINLTYAGSQYKGAIEDVSNLNKIPSITCEVLSPFANVGEGSITKSLMQMESFISYTNHNSRKKLSGKYLI